MPDWLDRRDRIPRAEHRLKNKMTAPRVLHIIDSFEQGGTERQTLQLVRLLHESGRSEVRLACLQDKGSLRSEAEAIGTGEIFEYPLTSFYDRNFVTQLRRLHRFLRDGRFDIVHAHCFYTNIFGMAAATMAQTPVRLAFKGETISCRTATQERFERGAFRIAHRVIANSEAVRARLIAEGVPAEKIVRLYNALNMERVAVAPGFARDQILRMFGLPNNRRFVTLVANPRLVVKDHPMFLRAAARVRHAVADAAFVIAGEGPRLPDLRELAAQLGLDQDVFFIGRCDRVAELLFVSEVCALSSRAEGFSNSILEYMAAARPVVATDVGGAREAIVDGETGHLVSAGDDEKMAEAIIQLLREPRAAREMGERGKRRVIEQFSTQRQVDDTVAMYGELLGNRPTSKDRHVLAEDKGGTSGSPSSPPSAKDSAPATV